MHGQRFSTVVNVVDYVFWFVFNGEEWFFFWCKYFSRRGKKDLICGGPGAEMLEEYHFFWVDWN